MSVHDRRLDSRGMPKHPSRRARRARSTSFAAVLLIIVGVIHVVQGVAALGSEGFYESPKGYFVPDDMVTTWGWAHLLLGVAAVAAGWSLRTRAMWARGAAVAVATVSMFGNFIWMPFAPFAAAVLIVLNVFVMWAAFADNDRQAPASPGRP